MIGFFSALGKLIVLFIVAPLIGGVIDGFLGIGMVPSVVIGWIIAVAVIWYVG